MKDEIKEILDKLDYIISRTEDDILVNDYGIEIEDYITNLQQENERLKKALCKDNIVPKCKYDYLKRQKEGLELDLFCIIDYKSRCEKAIEYINKEFKDEPYSVFIYGKTNIDNLLNILQGVGKDE